MKRIKFKEGMHTFMKEETKKEIYNRYISTEAQQSVDYIFGICEKCYNKGLHNSLYPKNEVKEIVETIADEFEYLTSTNY